MITRGARRGNHDGETKRRDEAVKPQPPPDASDAPIRELDLSRSRIRSLASLSRKVSRAQFVHPIAAEVTVQAIFWSLPDALAARDLLQLADCISAARRAERLCLLMMVAVVAGLSRGVVVNFGSAVVMPEVFLKALNLGRNLGRNVRAVSPADMDFIHRYRPRMNVIESPTRDDGCGVVLTDHHEITFPLLAVAIRVALNGHLHSRSAAKAQPKHKRAKD